MKLYTRFSIYTYALLVLSALVLEYDYYNLLGVSRNASKKEIKQSYRKLVKKYHPDKNKCHNAESKFIEFVKVYEILLNSNTRSIYDQFGSSAFLKSQDISKTNFNKEYFNDQYHEDDEYGTNYEDFHNQFPGNKGTTFKKAYNEYFDDGFYYYSYYYPDDDDIPSGFTFTSNMFPLITTTKSIVCSIYAGMMSVVESVLELFSNFVKYVVNLVKNTK